MITPSPFKRALFFIILDALFSLLSLYLAYSLRFNFDIPSKFLEIFFPIFFLLVGLKITSFFLFRVYHIVWRFFGFSEVKNIVLAHIVAYSLFVIIFLIFKEYFTPFARSIIIIDFVLSLMFIGTLRVLKRLIIEYTANTSMKPTLIIGANSKATIIKNATSGEIDNHPVAIISFEPQMIGTYMNNVKVFEMHALEEIIREKGIVSVVIVEDMSQTSLQHLFNQLNDLGISDIKKYKLLGSQHDKLESLSIEDLLAREPKDLDRDIIREFITGKDILITGAGGSIGSEIARQCEQFGANSLTLVDNSEYNLYQIGEQIENATLKLLSVTDKERLEQLFQETKPQIVIHAAAYKHVPICEDNQEMAVYNNVIGSKNVIDVSIANEVQKVVMISTDKAVRPTNVMGATKRVAELYANNVETKDTEIVSVRFGNVLGSSGSVIPKFKQQIEAGGPVTVTHPEITRYFMLIQEACQLVLQTASIAKGGELFVLDMGKPIKIVDLAKQMIRLYGKEEEVKIAFTGLRPGEKLYEELLIDESEQETQYSSIFIAKPTPYSIEQLTTDIDALLLAKDKVKSLQKIVPEFTRKV